MVENVTRTSEDQHLSNNILFNVLSNKRRRFTLYCLEKYQTPIALADLAGEVALLESDAETLLDILADDVKETYLDLYHCQIPKLEEVDLLTYSQERDTVSLKYDLSDLNLEKFL